MPDETEGATAVAEPETVVSQEALATEGGATEGAEGAAEEKAPEVKAAPEETDESLLASARSARTAFNRGESNKFELSDKQRALLARDDERVQTQANAARQAEVEYRKHAEEVSKRFSAASQSISDRVASLLQGAHVELSDAEIKLFDKEMAEDFAGLELGSAEIHLTPILALERAQLRATLSGNKLMSDGEAWELVKNLPLSSANPNEQPSIMSVAYSAGVAVGRRQPPSADQMVMTKKDYDAAVKKAWGEGEAAARGENGAAGTVSAGRVVSSGGLPTFAQWQAMTLEQREERRRADPQIEQKLSMRP